MYGHSGRTNADKRRAVEIALAEFPKLSSRAVADLCGVHHTFVQKQRPEQVATVATSTVTGADGKQYPAKRKAKTEEALRLARGREGRGLQSVRGSSGGFFAGGGERWFTFGGYPAGWETKC